MKLFGEEIKLFVILGIWFLMWGLNSFVYAMLDYTFFDFLILGSFTHVGNFVGGISFMLFGYILYRKHLTWGDIKKVLSERDRNEKELKS